MTRPRNAGVASVPWSLLVRIGVASGFRFDDTATKTGVLGGSVCVAPLSAVVLAEPRLATVIRTGARSRVRLGWPCRTREFTALE